MTREKGSRETRGLTIAQGAELRVETRDDKARIFGHAALFDEPVEIAGMFRERIARGAFSAAIGRDDVRALINHEPDLVLGRSTAGTLKLAEDDKGLAVEIDPPDTQAARDLLVSMRRGDITQMSFGFTARRQEWDDTQDPPLRTLLEVELFDVSVVTFPAYPQTDAAVRSLKALQEARGHGVPVELLRRRLALAERGYLSSR